MTLISGGCEFELVEWKQLAGEVFFVEFGARDAAKNLEKLRKID